MTSEISNLVRAHRPELSRYEDLYKHFHAHPELSFEEHETSAKIQSELSRLGSFEVFPGIGKTGVAAFFKNGDGKTVLLRADIDALPVPEKTGLGYASTKNMVMHVNSR
jgi:metal-dependent amidase/aminoacylase/carboxypeptidase family protein